MRFFKSILSVSVLALGLVSLSLGNGAMVDEGQATTIARGVVKDSADSMRVGIHDSLTALCYSGAELDTVAGFTTTVTDSLYYTVCGQDVDLTITAASGTSNTTALTQGTRFTGIRPVHVQNRVVTGLTDSAVTSLPGSVSVGTTGTLTYSTFKVVQPSNRVQASATFLGSSTKGFALHGVHYSKK